MASGSNGCTTTVTPPSLPIELVEEEILYRLPVKTLMKFRCVCKSWKSLISDDPKFVKKHLRMSKFLKHKHHLITNIFFSLNFWDSPISSVLSDESNHTVTQTQLKIPIPVSRHITNICSCDGILCFTIDDGKGCPVLCNPSLRKYSILPPLENHRKRSYSYLGSYSPFWFSFGYDHFNDVYKVVAVSDSDGDNQEVDVYTLGTNNWKSIQDIPSSSTLMHQRGVFVGGTVNWLASEFSNDISSCVVSLDLEKESYQNFSVPNDLEIDCLSLGVLKDCLCIVTSYDMILAVWIMKEYENEMFWNKLYYSPCVVDRYICPKIVYIYDDDNDQVLFQFFDRTNDTLMLAVYNSKNGNVKIPDIQHKVSWTDPEVYVESLISLPCSY